MKTSMKKVLSLALAGALALTSVFSANVADASNAKKAAAVPTASFQSQQQRIRQLMLPQQ